MSSMPISTIASARGKATRQGGALAAPLDQLRVRSIFFSALRPRFARDSRAVGLHRGSGSRTLWFSKIVGFWNLRPMHGSGVSGSDRQ
jgi:hypothetical protein